MLMLSQLLFVVYVDSIIFARDTAIVVVVDEVDAPAVSLDSIVVAGDPVFAAVTVICFCFFDDAFDVVVVVTFVVVVVVDVVCCCC